MFLLACQRVLQGEKEEKARNSIAGNVQAHFY